MLKKNAIALNKSPPPSHPSITANTSSTTSDKDTATTYTSLMLKPPDQDELQRDSR